jgi:hypothetical protein
VTKHAVTIDSSRDVFAQMFESLCQRIYCDASDEVREELEFVFYSALMGSLQALLQCADEDELGYRLAEALVAYAKRTKGRDGYEIPVVDTPEEFLAMVTKDLSQAHVLVRQRRDKGMQ